MRLKGIQVENKHFLKIKRISFNRRLNPDEYMDKHYYNKTVTAMPRPGKYVSVQTSSSMSLAYNFSYNLHLDH